MSKWSFKGKMLGLFGVACVLLVGIALGGNWTAVVLKDKITLLGDENIPKSDALADIRTGTQGVARFMWLALAFPHGSKERAEAITKVEHYIKMQTEAMAKYKTFALSDAESSAIGVIETEMPESVKGAREGAEMLLDKSGQVTEAAVKAHLIEKMAPPALKINAKALELSKLNKEANAATVREALVRADQARWSMLAISMSFAVVFLIFCVRFLTSLSKHLGSITESVAGASEQVAAASQQLSSAAEELSSTSQEQASAVEETSASLTEISGMVQSNSKGAEKANEILKKVCDTSEEAKASMDNLSLVMKSILQSNEKIEKLVKIIQEIGDKTEIIDDIVFQTQLLSFNASVEAERAGEHGRGFAVVAQEVGTLAQLSGKAATEISSIVKSSIKEAEEVAKENRTKVESGGTLTSETSEQIEKVLEDLKVVAEAMGRIVAASHEQSQGVEQINTSVVSVNQTTQQIASSAEESASASAELSSQAESMMALVGSLREIVNGASEGSSSEEVANVVSLQPKLKKGNVSKSRTVVPAASAIKVAAGAENQEWEKL